MILIALITPVFNLDGPVPALALCLLLAAVVNGISSTCAFPAATMPAMKKARQNVLRIVAREKCVFNNRSVSIFVLLVKFILAVVTQCQDVTNRPTTKNVPLILNISEERRKKSLINNI